MKFRWQFFSRMAVDKNHQGKGCAFPECPSFGHLRFSACCFPCRCRWGSWWKSQEVLWTFRIFPNKRNGHETYSFYRRYSKIILGSLWWQALLIGNCLMSFGTDDSFNYFSFFPARLSGNSGKQRKSKQTGTGYKPLQNSLPVLVWLRQAHKKCHRNLR